MKFSNWCKAFAGIVIYYGLLEFVPILVLCVLISAAAGFALECGAFMQQLLTTSFCSGQFVMVPLSFGGDILTAWAGYGVAVGCLLGLVFSSAAFFQHHEELAGKPLAQQRLEGLAGDAVLTLIMSVLMLNAWFYEEKVCRLHPHHEYYTYALPLMMGGEFGYIPASYYWDAACRQKIEAGDKSPVK